MWTSSPAVAGFLGAVMGAWIGTGIDEPPADDRP